MSVRVKCPSCGKEFDIPDGQANRMLKCMCRNLFRASPISKPDDGAAKEKDIQEETPTYQLSMDFSEDDQAPESKLSEDELSGFLKDLKKNREKIAEVPQEKAPATANLKALAERANMTIDVDLPTPAMPKTELVDFPLPPELSNGEELTRTQTLDESTITLEQSADPFRKFVEWFSKSKFKVPLLVGTACFVVLAISLSLLISREESPHSKDDPYLTKLITPQAGPKVTEPPPAEPAALPIVKIEAKTEKAKPESARVAVPLEDNPTLSKMLRDTYDGEFENVVRIGTNKGVLENEEQALFYEALIARAGTDLARIKEIESQIVKVITSNSSPALLRARAAAIIRKSSSQKDLLNAIEILKSLSVTRQRDALVFSYLGLAYEKLDREDLAHKVWDQALILVPNYSWLIEHRENLYREAQNFKAASDMAKLLRGIPGHEHAANMSMADLAALQDKDAEAVQYYRDAIKSKDTVRARLQIGSIISDKDPDRAQKDLEIALNLNPTPTQKRDIYFQLGKIYCKRKDYQKSSALFRRSLQADKPLLAIYYQKGACEYGAGLYAQASETFESALKLNTKNEQIWLSYGMALTQAGKTRAALAAYNRSIDLKPTDSNHYQMAILLGKLDRKQEAVIHLRKALKINAKNKDARALLNKFSK